MRILYQSRKSFSSGKYKNFAQKRILKIPHRFRIMNSHFLPSPYSLGFRTIKSMKKSDFRSFSTTTLRSNISHRAKRDISRTEGAFHVLRKQNISLESGAFVTAHAPNLHRSINEEKRLQELFHVNSPFSTLHSQLSKSPAFPPNAPHFPCVFKNFTNYPP